MTNKKSCTTFSRILPASLLLCFFRANIAFSQGPQSIEPMLAPLPVEEAISQKEFYYNNQIRLSPDGQWIVYAIRDPRRYENTRETHHKSLIERGSSKFLQGWK